MELVFKMHMYVLHVLFFVAIHEILEIQESRLFTCESEYAVNVLKNACFVDNSRKLTVKELLTFPFDYAAACEVL